MLAWVASLGVIGAVSVAAITEREAVMRAWAPSQRAYHAIGLDSAHTVTTGLGAVPTAAPAAPATSPPE